MLAGEAGFIARRRSVLTRQNGGLPPPRFSLQREILRYCEIGQEAERLESPFSRWEKLRTLDLLDRFLPRAPALFLDVGGAAGAYAFPLAEAVTSWISWIPFLCMSSRLDSGPQWTSAYRETFK
jgi:hypothetical protein